MDPNSVLSKTEKGAREIETRTHRPIIASCGTFPSLNLLSEISSAPAKANPSE